MSYATELYKYLKAAGLSDTAAYAIIGNSSYETANFTEFSGDKGNSGGAFHFNGPRLQGLRAYAKAKGIDPNSPEAGAGYLIKEVQDGVYVPSNLFEKLNKASSIAEATKIFSDEAERPGIPRIEKRIKYAEKIPSILSNTIEISPQKETSQGAITRTTQPSTSLGTVTPYQRPEMPKPITAGTTLAKVLSGEAGLGEIIDSALDLRGQIAKAPGYGDMSHFRAGLSGASNDYRDMSLSSLPMLQSLMQLVMSGRN